VTTYTRSHLIDSRFATIRSNSYVNPSLETPSTTMEFRRNLVVDPFVSAWVGGGTSGTLALSNARWFGGGTNAGTHTVVTGATDGPLPGITTYGRKTWTTADGTGGGDSGISSNQWTGYNSGANYTASVWVRSSVARNWFPEAQFADSAGVLSERMQPQSVQVSSVAGQWVQLRLAFTSPQAAGGRVMILWDTDTGTPWPTGGTLDITGFMVEEVGTPGSLLRTNLHTNPSLAVGGTNWSNSVTGGTTTATRETSFSGTTSTPPGVTGWYKVVFGTTPTGSPATINTTLTGLSGIPVIGGQQYTFSAYVVSSYTGYAGVRLDIGWYDAAGAAIGADTTGASTLTTANAWERRSKTLTAPASAAFVSVGVAFSAPTSAPAGTVIGATGVLIERVATAGSFFDGATLGNTVDNSWAGTPGASASVQRDPPTGFFEPFFAGSFRPQLRLNLARNPALEVDTAGWQGNNTATIARSTAQFHSGVASLAVTHDGSTGLGASQALTGVFPSPRGGTVTTSAWVLIPTGTTIRFVTQEYTPASAPAGNGTIVDVVGTGAWQRISSTKSGVVAGNTVRLTSFLNSAQPAGTYYIDEVLTEESATVGTYFDGSTTMPAGYGAAWAGTANASASYVYDVDLTAAWAGTANASASVLQAPNAWGLVGDGGVRKAYQSSRWAARGTKSIRIATVRSADSSDSFAIFTGNGGMLAGHTYLVSATVHLEAAQRTPLNVKARRIRVQINNPGVVEIAGELIAGGTNAPGTYRYAELIAIPATATTVNFVRFMNGGLPQPGVDDGVYLDEIVIEDVTMRPSVNMTTPPGYFDGSFPWAAWAGAVNNSASATYQWANP